MTERAYTGVQYMHELSASALADPACPDSAAHSLIMVDCEVERRYWSGYNGCVQLLQKMNFPATVWMSEPGL